MKRIIDIEKLKNLSIYVVFDKNNVCLGFYRTYFDGNISNPDKFTRMEIIEYEDNRLYSKSDKEGNSIIKRFEGYNEYECVKNQNLFGFDISEIHEGFHSLDDILSRNGFKIIKPF